MFSSNFLLKHPLVLSSPLPFPCVLAWVRTCARTHAGIVQRLVSPLKCSPPSQAHWSCQFSLTRQPALRISCLHLHRARIIDLVYIWVPRSPSSCAHDGEQALGLLSLFCVSSPRTDSKSPLELLVLALMPSLPQTLSLGFPFCLIACQGSLNVFHFRSVP